MMTTARIWTVIEAMLITVVWIDYIDIGLRILAGAAGLIVAYFAAMAYRAQKKLAERELRELDKKKRK